MYVITYMDSRTNRTNYHQKEIDTIYKHRAIKAFIGDATSLIPDPTYIRIENKSLTSIPEYKLYLSKHIKSMITGEELTKNTKYHNDSKLNINEDITSIEDKYKRMLGKQIRLKDYFRGKIEEEISKGNPYIISNTIVLELSDEENYSAENMYSRNLVKDFRWVEQIIEFFRVLTQYQIIVEEEAFIKGNTRINPVNYFLFNKRGEVKSFIALTALNDKYMGKEDRYRKIVEINNVKVLQIFLNGVYTMLERKNNFQLWKQVWSFRHAAPKHVLPLFDRIRLGANSTPKSYPFKCFEDIEKCLKGEERKARKRVGVFLDNANIETSFFGFRVDLYRLIYSMYDVSEYQVVKQVSTLFKPTMETNEEQDKSDRKKQTRKEHLEGEEFEVTTVSNGYRYANQCDDEVLKEIINNSLDELDSILILSGDAHFLDIFRKCRELGKELRIISATKSTTGQGIIDEFSEELSYLYEYYECIYISKRINKNLGGIDASKL